MSETFTTYGIGPGKYADELQALRDERDRLRSALEDACLTYAVHGEQPPEKWLAALTPAEGGKNEK